MAAEMYRAIKYRIYPNERQIDLLAQTFGCVRKVYNMALELQEGLYSAGMGSMSQTALNNYCNRYWKKEFPFLREVDKFALTNALINLDNAYHRFFNGQAKHPKYKSRRSHDFSYKTNWTNGNISIDVKGRTVKLPKLGAVNTAIHRSPKKGWNIESATVSLTPSGKYYVAILFKFDADIPCVTPTFERTLGLDYSSPHFYVDSNGHPEDMPHWYHKAEKRLAREQRRLSRMVKGSRNYEKQRILVSKLHESAANKRRDFCHKLSRKIANSYDAVCVEDINLRNMAQSLRLGKATNDNGFGMFRNFLRYKLEEQGKYQVVIDKWFPSSKTCNACGSYNPNLTLGERTWVCPGCGRVVDRDHNAARNIRDEGFRNLMERIQSAV